MRIGYGSKIWHKIIGYPWIVCRLIDADRGVTAIEYALIAALIAVAVLLLLIVAGIAFIAWQRGPRGPSTPEGAYGTVVRIASRLGFGPRPDQTVYEYARALGAVLPGSRPELELVANAKGLKAKHGFTSHKLKGGVFDPVYELECYRALAHELGTGTMSGDSFRFDPNASWSTEQAIWFGQQIEDINNDYLEDPVYGLHGMRRTREKVRMPLATNTVVVNFEQLAANILNTAVDVILLDTTFWGGIRQCVKAAGICETFQLGVAVHSSGELGIQLATMLHLGAVIPNLSYAADAHYHHLTDDIIAGGLMTYVDGKIRVPDGPGLGVKLDRDKLAEYSELYERLGGYPYDKDPLRPDWSPVVPNTRWADQHDDRTPEIMI
jgi:glucarate dehydratase